MRLFILAINFFFEAEISGKTEAQSKGTFCVKETKNLFNKFRTKGA